MRVDVFDGDRRRIAGGAQPLVERALHIVVHLVAGRHRLGLLFGELGQLRIDNHRAEAVVLAVLRDHDRRGGLIERGAGLRHVEIHGRLIRNFDVSRASGKQQEPDNGGGRPFQ